LKKEHKERGKIKMSKLLQEYQPGNRVVVRIDPSIQKGMPHRRFHGKTGTVTEKRGRSYVVTVPQGNAVKEIIVRPEHIEPFKGD
jgi:large subunit ribosomal protein L21e